MADELRYGFVMGDREEGSLQSTEDELRYGSGLPEPDSHRDEAIRLVDQKHGYTVEFSSNPEAHRAEYDEYEAILESVHGVHEHNMNPDEWVQHILNEVLLMNILDPSGTMQARLSAALLPGPLGYGVLIGR